MARIYKSRITKEQQTMFKAMATNTPLWYIGGKAKLYKIISNILPSDTKEIISPFIGGGALELKLSATGIRVHAYDKLEPLVNFWQCMLSYPDKVIENVSQHFPLYDHYYDLYDNYPPHKNATDDDALAVNAAAFWAINRGSYSGISLAQRGTSHDSDKKSPLSKFFYTWYHFYAPNLSVDCLSFEESLNKHPDMIAYLDPPYVGREQKYGDKRKGDQVFDHEKLRDLLGKRERPWVLSYQSHPTIMELYKEFDIYEIQWTYFCNPVGKNMKSDKQEIIIRNF